MIRLYDHITVLPGSRDRQQLKRIRRRATDLDRPLVVYPEGTRTRDGSLRPFRTSGLRSILTCRRWQVYLVVLDGLWKAGRFSEFVANISGIDGEVDMVGPYEFDPEKDDAKLFIPEMERRMAEKLAEMRRTKGRTTDHSDVVERS
jgi:1-acyl-sn-glycerol-3-phosphate acyltransferase